LLGPREKGGYEREFDVVAIDVKQRKILQYEPPSSPHPQDLLYRPF
jgi:hypothetical protein